MTKINPIISTNRKINKAKKSDCGKYVNIKFFALSMNLPRVWVRVFEMQIQLHPLCLFILAKIRT
jgi:hypothetical protein